MDILYVATKYDYGNPEQGLSFEHCNFFDCLHHMGHDILYFDFMALMQQHGKDWMNRRLLEVVKAYKPALMFTFLATDELQLDTVKTISEGSDTVTFNWFADDHWRFDDFTRYWAPCFNWSATTAQTALPKYQQIGYRNVIKSQWACNSFSYRKLDLPLTHDVTFIGQPHGNRRRIIELLRRAGVSVRVWGRGWETGRLAQDGMIQVFNQSRINLNLTNSSIPEHPSVSPVKPTPGDKGSRVISWAANATPMGRMLNSGIKKLLPAFRYKPQQHPSPITERYVEQIKGRNFEVPGCGGFLLTGQADNLADYYDLGREVVCFNDEQDLVQKVLHYLHHETDRSSIADAGYRRTLREHTYVHRFTEVFKEMGFSSASAEEILQNSVQVGAVEEIR